MFFFGVLEVIEVRNPRARRSLLLCVCVCVCPVDIKVCSTRRLALFSFFGRAPRGVAREVFDGEHAIYGEMKCVNARERINYMGITIVRAIF